ncbi:MAG: hypothetical protein M3Y93_14260 [Pseudomonadota bacterium]|nr:hypothetical protein [Pseudomonadota bacterium]
MDTGLAQRMQQRRHFPGSRDEVTVHHGSLVASAERGRGGQPHRSSDLHAVHAALPPDCRRAVCTAEAISKAALSEKTKSCRP